MFMNDKTNETQIRYEILKQMNKHEEIKIENENQKFISQLKREEQSVPAEEIQNFQKLHEKSKQILKPLPIKAFGFVSDTSHSQLKQLS